MRLKRTRQLALKLPDDFRKILVLIVIFGEYFYAIFVHLYLGADTIKTPPPPDLNTWVSLYKKRQLTLLSNFIPRIFFELLPAELQKNHLLKWTVKKSPEFSFHRLRKLDSRLAKLDPHLQNLWHFFESNKGQVFNNMIDSLTEMNSSRQKVSIPLFMDDFLNPYMRFYFMNWISCWLFYGEHFPRLLQKARKNNLPALEKLLKLDKRAIYEPGIAKIWKEVSFQPQSKKFKRLVKALEQPPQIPDKKQIKILFAALISVIAERNNFKLRPHQIQKFFESMSFDIAGKPDFDLPDSPDAFRKGISRQKAFWKPLFTRYLST